MARKTTRTTTIPAAAATKAATMEGDRESSENARQLRKVITRREPEPQKYRMTFEKNNATRDWREFRGVEIDLAGSGVDNNRSSRHFILRKHSMAHIIHSTQQDEITTLLLVHNGRVFLVNE
mmetsp:Transcript_18174/g.41723  ORF Transcript_18174/g.41723 Transcript_18174/m.41723 type:complete len:122 (+) Transcript_18174:1264-1629(+)